jgi:tRNA U34 5-carboxymethylaminomethyl modifying enzyme MnmG/GidA
VFEKSMQVYMMDPEKRGIYEEEIEKLRSQLRGRQPLELTREQCLESVKHLEKAKFDAQVKMYEMVKNQRIPPNMINAIIKVEKLKADDEFFNTFGIEEEDIDPNIKRLNLE